MKRLSFWAVVASVVVFALVAAARPQGPTMDGDRVTAIASELRCPVCQGLSVADSDSPTARDIRNDIAKRVAVGQSGDEIRDAYVARFGEWVLLRPERDGLGGLVWLVPPVVAAAGAAGLTVGLWRWRKQRRYTASEADVELVARALRESRA
jgi:cytochrome c-type biogenesis protein CcmH